MCKNKISSIFIFVGVVGCGGDPGVEAPTSTNSEQTDKPTSAPAPVGPARLAEATKHESGPPADNGEACGQMIVSAYRGAKFADRAVVRSQEQAKARARTLLDRVKAGADFEGLATTESEAPSSAPRGGVMGTFAREDWPDIHAALEGPLFALAVGGVAPAPVETPYGYVVLKRCPVEKAHGRHILVRYAGAKRADESVTRTRAEARGEAEALLAKLTGGQDFAALARERSEDSSAERGGDIGSPGRGRLAVAFERALFGLQPGQRSGVVETEYGFHIIERLPAQ